MKFFMNGLEILRVEEGNYYKIADVGCMEKCTRKEFIEELKSLSYSCLTTWDKKFRQDYLDMVDYVKSLEK